MNGINSTYPNKKTNHPTGSRFIHISRTSLALASGAALLLSLSVLGNCKPSPKDAGKFGKDGCEYRYNPMTTKLTWTAYKFVEKAGVKGKFKKITLKDSKTSANPLAVFKRANFEIPVSSLDSGVPARDKKIREAYFGTLKDTQTIRGKIKEVNPDGSGVVSLRLNKIWRDAPAKFSLKNHVNLKAELTINIEDWEGQQAVTELNKVCSEQHKGKDGKSMLWPDVKIEITSKLDETCG